jgi:hypothetical protein
MEAKQLRGFELAGLRLVVEVPTGWNWVWPDVGSQRSCSFEKPDIHVAVHALREQRVLEHAQLYSHEGSLFEAERCGGNSYLLVSGDRRLARLDADARRCDVWLPPTAIRSRVLPLARPLADLVLIHRALARGALAVRATAAVRRGRALVVLGESRLADPKPGTVIWAGWLLLEPRVGGAWVYPLPSTLQTGVTPQVGALLEGLQTTQPGSNDDSLTQILDPESAAAEILRFAFAPVTGDTSANPMLEAATRLAESVSTLRLGAVGGERFGWRRTRSASCLVPPAGA